MLKVIRKIFFAIVLLRVIAMVADVAHGPVKVIGIVALLFCGIRMVFSKDTDGG